MLINAKPELENSIKTALYDALKEAHMTFFTKGDNDVANNAMELHLQTMADKFATAASTNAAPKIADAIYKFVLQIGIEATPMKLKAQNYPVIGVINQTEFKIS